METENSEVQLRIIVPPKLPDNSKVSRVTEVNPVITPPDRENLVIIYTNDRHNIRCICACVVLFIVIIVILSILYKH